MRSGNSAIEGTSGFESVLKLRLMAFLTDMVREHGMIGTADLLGVSRKTMWRARASGTLPPSLLAALEKLTRRGDDEAAAQRERIGVPERRVAELEGKLEAGQVHATRTAIDEQSGDAAEGFARQLGEVESRLAKAETALREGRMASRDRGVNAEVWRNPGGVRQGVVTLEAHGAAAPLVSEWRRVCSGGVDEGNRRSEVRSRRMTLARVRGERPGPVAAPAAAIDDHWTVAMMSGERERIRATDLGGWDFGTLILGCRRPQAGSVE